LALLVAPAAIAVASGQAQSSTSCAAWMNTHKTPEQRADALLRAMTLQDKVNEVTGDTSTPSPSNTAQYASYPNYGAAGVVFANPRLCIPPLVLNDANAGVADMQINVTAYPDGVTQASTWDVPLMLRFGRILGHEAFIKGVNVLLAPGMNIIRDPLNGRGWEYYGEDPFLSGQSTAAFIAGVQQNPVIATAKHYAAQDQEGTSDNNDGPVSNNVDRRTMEEIELPPFDDAVRAGVGAVMCTADKLNNIFGCQNRQYLTGVLRGQLHFSGFVTSDWGAAQSTVGSADGGMDMEMPSATYYGPALQTAVEQGKVSMATLDTMVHRILFTMFRLGLFDHVPQEGSQAFYANASTPASIAMATQIAEEGTDLLKNDHGILPLTGSGRTIALIGSPASPQGATLAEQGYGSAHVPEPGYPPNVVSPLQAISARAARAGDTVTYNDGSSAASAALAAKAADVAIVFISDVSSEGFDRPDMNPRAGTCDLAVQSGCNYESVDQNALTAAVAAANPNTVVVLQNGGPLSMPWIKQVRGVLENWYPGQVDGDAIAPILFGDVDPSGHLPETIPYKLSDGPLRTAIQYPGVKGQVDHTERLLIGYRWYTAKHIAPLFPFGFGLSYTTFRFSGLSARASGPNVVVKFLVQNTGRRAGTDVAQVYVGDPPSTGEPPEQLAGFQRVTLAPGEGRTVRIVVDRRSLSYWSVRWNGWRLMPGCYRLMVGDSSASLAPPQAIEALRRRAATAGRARSARRRTSRPRPDRTGIPSSGPAPSWRSPHPAPGGAGGRSSSRGRRRTRR
jgi:beta-glucosidase